ncbi:AsnC family transcriptional regulator [Candidatus Villigracilis saccharophilus]|uniref:Lrp/AsnC family transcriptional regulator n=1 Tax=Candidatus Villigracilis saccharophilus TaxID=3140684 RepID=UPI003136E3EA|nr:AsnC family transcriptional regulator [Anaerolineales bacterium]
MESSISINQLENLDSIDLYLIEALQKDGREAFAQIADQLKVSPGMIRQRYNRLVELGYLKVVAVTNPLMMGVRKMAMIGIRTDGGKLMQVAENFPNSRKSFIW